CSQPHIQTHSQDHNVEIRTLLTSHTHTLYQQTNTTMDTFLIRKSQATDAPVAKKPKLRKYDKSYLQFGFTVTGTTEQRPQCVLCAEVLANDEAMQCMQIKKAPRHQTP